MKIKIKSGKTGCEIVDYDPAVEEYAAILAEMDRYNDFIAVFAIEAGNNGVPFRMNCNSLFPVFNSLDLTLGGRYFGAVYQQVRSEIRGFIKIDGQETTELDFSACFGRMLYNLIGEEYDGDPYEAPEAMALLESIGLSYCDARGIIKIAFQLLINCTGEIQAANSLKDNPDIKKIVSLSLNQSIQIIRMLFHYHPSIQWLFYENIGNNLMNLESQIAGKIMLEGINKGICVLVIHDSFIVQSIHTNWLRETMINSYVEILGFIPKVK